MSETPLSTLAQAIVTPRIGKAIEVAQARTRTRRHALAIVFELGETGECPAWAQPLSDGRAVQFIGGLTADRAAFTLEAPPPGWLVFELKPGQSAVYRLVVGGEAREVCAFGARGDRKTSTADLAFLGFAQRHADAGYPLPVVVLTVTGTLAEHRVKLVPSLQAAWWAGIWTFRDDYHVAVGTVGGKELVHLRLTGLEDQAAHDRVRTEAHALWVEEPAPAMVMEPGSGVGEDAFGLALTSLRLPSVHHPTLVTSNYPDADFWLWQRFVVKRHPGTAYVRIPPGESASAEDRAAWAEALEGRPDLMRRLLAGEPGLLVEGPQVAVGYRTDLHVSRQRLRPSQNLPLLIGMDGGLTPSATVAQYAGATLRVLAALCVERGGTRQLCEDYIRPWLASNASWALGHARAVTCYIDPSLDVPDQSNLEASPTRVIRQVLGAVVHLGPVPWPARRDPLLALLGKLDPLTGTAALQLDPEEATLLDRALSGRWHYPLVRGQVSREGPVKNHPWSDIADSASYIVAGVAPNRERRDPKSMEPSKTDFSVFDHVGQGRRSGFGVRRAPSKTVFDR